MEIDRLAVPVFPDWLVQRKNKGRQEEVRNSGKRMLKKTNKRLRVKTERKQKEMEKKKKEEDIRRKEKRQRERELSLKCC